MRQHLRRSSLAVSLVTAIAALATLPLGPAQAAANRVTVPLGHSIQKVIDRSPSGTVILLEPGVYKESLQIRKDNITLQGSGASDDGTLLVPPDSYPSNACTRFTGGSGVCVLATRVDHGQVVNPAKDDTVTGIKFKGFKSMGVFAYGTMNLSITNNAAVDNGEYGFARFNSSGGLVQSNSASGSEEAGVYVGDSPNAQAIVRGNTVSGNQFGIFIRHARHVEVAYNTADGNCEGILVFDDGEKGGAGNVNVHNNVFHSNNQFCKGSPPLQGGGVLLLGATLSIVARNNVLGNQGTQLNSGGIVLLSAKPITGGSDVIDNIVRNNTAYSNEPADIIYDGSGHGNQFYTNHCDTSMPDGLCG